MSPEYTAQWIRKAEADRAAAKRALQDARRRTDQAEIACFHAQQCAEKYLKAVLAKRGRGIPRVHDLVALAGLIKGARLSLSRLRGNLELLNRYAVTIRYPGFSATFVEAQKAVHAMDKLVQAAQAALRQ